MLFACGSSYVYATLITGDPFFPLFSDALHARFPADVMSDPQWLAPIDASIPWQLTFHTEKFIEGMEWRGGILDAGVDRRRDHCVVFALDTRAGGMRRCCVRRGAFRRCIISATRIPR